MTFDSVMTAAAGLSAMTALMHCICLTKRLIWSRAAVWLRKKLAAPILWLGCLYLVFRLPMRAAAALPFGIGDPLVAMAASVFVVSIPLWIVSSILFVLMTRRASMADNPVVDYRYFLVTPFASAFGLMLLFSWGFLGECRPLADPDLWTRLGRISS